MTSFDFTWNQGAKPAAKVFARKKTNKTSSPEARTAKGDTEGKLIKRKQKKDKLALKQGTQEGKDAPQQSQTTHSLFSVPRKNVYVDTQPRGKSVVEEVFSAEKAFSDLGVHRHLVSNLEKNSFTTLTTVQEKAIPEIISGNDVLIRSQTGSGKTLAYAVPIINSLLEYNPRLQRNSGVQALIVVPTRELALQTQQIFNKINTFQWIVIGHLCGGENRKTEKDRLRKGVHVLIGTPGRLLDHVLHTTALKIDAVKWLVLDEADRLLDMGFKKDIVKIVEELDKSKNNHYDPMALLKGHKPEEEGDKADDKRQTLLLSATLNKSVAELADFAMKDHLYIDTLENINSNHMVIPNTVDQEFIITYAKHRLFTLSAVLLTLAKRKLFVFMATSQMVDYHYDLFTKYLVNMPRNRGKLKIGDVAVLESRDFEDSDEDEVVLDSEFFKLHGSMDQSARKEVFEGFRKAKKGILICTDVVARGVDVPEADCIIQYTGPQSDEDYLHRVGRTGRAGKSGTALLFLTHEEQEYVTRLQQHKVFLKERKPDEFLERLAVLMEDPDRENAASALQRRYEAALTKHKELYRSACFAYSSWSRFYNTYPAKMREVFNFKNVNLGHYVTSFGIKETPSAVARVVRGQVVAVKPKKLNRKLATHGDEETDIQPKKRNIKSISLTTSEYGSGLEPTKKKKKKK